MDYNEVPDLNNAKGEGQMKSTKRSLSLIVALVILVLSLGAVSAAAESYPTKSPEEYVGEIDYWVWGDYEARCTEPFFELYPNVKINFVKVAQGDYFTKLQTAIASGGDMPDIGNLEMTPRMAWINLDCWERLDAPPYNYDKSVVVDWSLPLVMNQRGEIVAAQIDNCVGGIAYNRANAKMYYGISEVDEMEAMFQTIDDYIEASAVFKDGDGSHYMFGSVYDAFYAFYGLFADQANVTADDKLDLETNILPTFEIVEKLVANNACGKLDAWTPAWSASFSTDYSTFFPAVTWMVYDNIIPNDPTASNKYGLITPPGGGFSWGGTALAISKNAPQENKEIAWEFIRWFCLSEGGAQAFLDRNHAPTLYTPFYESDAYTSYVDVAFGGQNTLEKYMQISQNPNTKVRPMSMYDQIIMSAVEGVFNELENGMSAKDAVELVRAEVLSKARNLK